MSYTTVAIVAKLTGHPHGSGDAGGIIQQAIDSADLLINARIYAAGLTPPVSSNILKGASELIAKAFIRDRRREDGSLPVGQYGSFDTYDSTNKSIKLHIDLAYAIVDEYIKYASTSVAPSSTTGVSRSDYVFNDFKLDQSEVTGFVDINGDSLADDQES